MYTINQKYLVLFQYIYKSPNNILWSNQKFQTLPLVAILLKMVVIIKKYIPYIPENKPRIFGGFYKAKVGGSAYFRVYAPQKKITS